MPRARRISHSNRVGTTLSHRPTTTIASIGSVGRLPPAPTRRDDATPEPDVDGSAVPALRAMVERRHDHRRWRSMTTAAEPAEITIERNDAGRRYELRLDGELAGYAQFRTNPGRIIFTHTVVLPEYGGQGLGSRLAKHVLDDAVGRGDTIVPICPFIGAYLKNHPGYEASVDWP